MKQKIGIIAAADDEIQPLIAQMRIEKTEEAAMLKQMCIRDRYTNTNKAGVQEGKNSGMAPLAFRVVEPVSYTHLSADGQSAAGETALPGV